MKAVRDAGVDCANRHSERQLDFGSMGAPIPPLAVGVIFEVDATMPPELQEASNFQDDDETEGWITLVSHRLSSGSSVLIRFRVM